jgi:CBS domain-containing protein
MKKHIVKDLAVPLSEYATVPEKGNLFDAILALESAQQKFDPLRYRHRAVLVVDDADRVVGKIGQVDILRALEPKYDDLQLQSGMAHLGFTKKFVHSMLSSYNLWETPMQDICRKGASRKVKDFMSIPGEGEFIDENASLDVAIHYLVSQRYQSLLVTRSETVVGILRLTDVFSSVIQALKECRR